MYRYLALIWEARDFGRETAAAGLVRRLSTSSRGWTRLGSAGGVAQGGVGQGGVGQRGLAQGGLAMFHTGARPGASGAHLLPDDAGALFGTLFAGGAPHDAGPADRPSAVIESGGESLLRSHWGRYVALVRQPSGRTFVLRDPTGGLPCWLLKHEGVWVLVSDIEDALALGLRLSVNWPYVAALMADFALQARETGIEEVTEVQPGERVELQERSLARVLAWKPLDIARADPLEAPEAAAAALRYTARRCVQAWGACHARILHRLSGGLDSAIVLAALADGPTPPQVTCLNYFGTGPEEDERVFARRAAARTGHPLIEKASEPEGVRLEPVLRVARTPRPYFYLYSIEHGRYEADLAASLGATALFSGAGGDGLFYRDRAGLAAADYWCRHGLGPALLRVALDAAIVERVSLWSVLAAALRHRFLSTQGRWGARTSAPPGKVWHVRSFASPLPYYDPLGRPDDPESVHPLISQPLIEVCVRIPTYTLVSGGWDRAIARRAFAADLPSEIIRRRAKGGSTATVRRIFESNRPFLREVLLDGVLVRERLLDRRGLEQALAPGRSLVDTSFVQIVLQHLAAEAWLRRWLSTAGVSSAG